MLEEFNPQPYDHQPYGLIGLDLELLKLPLNTP